MSAFPFTIFEADVRLFTVGPEGEIEDEVWIGGCAETLEIRGERAEMRVEYPGRSAAMIRHGDESWRITLSNVRTVQVGKDWVQTPEIEHDREYALVIVWWDTGQRLWLKECYLGVKGQPASLSPQNIFQQLTFAAEQRVPVGGSVTAPRFDLVRNGSVIHVAPDGRRTLIYRYDGARRVFLPTTRFSAPMAQITSAGASLTVTIGGFTALTGNASGITVGRLIAKGGTRLQETPRLEFFSGIERVASLSCGSLVVPRAREATSSEASDDVEFNPVTWLFSLTTRRAVAPEFIERP
jgi:hypothetical protein